MRGNFGLFCSFSPKLPRIHVDYIVVQMRKINREKGYYPELKLAFVFGTRKLDFAPASIRGHWTH